MKKTQMTYKNKIVEFDVVIPVYNSENQLTVVIEELLSYLNVNRFSSNIILVNDASTDRSLEIIQSLVDKYSNIKSISLQKNVGQHIATIAGLSQSNSSHIVIMDDDGQNDPKEISKLLQLIELNHDLIFGSYDKKEHSMARNFGSKLFKFVIRILFKHEKSLKVSNFKLISHDLAQKVLAYSMKTPYLNGELIYYANSSISTPVLHRKSLKPRSTYKISSLLKIIFNLLFAYSGIPARFAVYSTIIFSFISLFFSIFLFIRGLLNETLVPGWTSLTVVFLLFFSLILVLVGIILEYLIRLTFEISDRPKFMVLKKN
jgi:glycosyltransferase involved in cell wall biosynthesis